MQMPEALTVTFPCGVSFSAPAGFLGEAAKNPEVVKAVNAAAGKPPTGPILDAIIALLPTILPIVLPLILQSFGSKQNGDGWPKTE